MAMAVWRSQMFRSRQVCPPPGWMAIWRNRLSNMAERPARITSQASAKFIPAPTAAPFTAATVGRGVWATRRNPA